MAANGESGSHDCRPGYDHGYNLRRKTGIKIIFRESYESKTYFLDIFMLQSISHIRYKYEKKKKKEKHYRDELQLFLF
jgi:hypothetical protein